MRFEPLFLHCIVLYIDEVSQIKKKQKPEVKFQRKLSKYCRKALRVLKHGDNDPPPPSVQV